MIQVRDIIIWHLIRHDAHVECYCSIQIHLMTFQGTRYCAKDPSLVSADEIKAARGELEPPSTEKKATLS